MFLFSHGLFQILTRGKSGLFPAFDVHSLKSCLSLIQQPLFMLNILQGKFSEKKFLRYCQGIRLSDICNRFLTSLIVF